jgi:hypothetical protein
MRHSHPYSPTGIWQSTPFTYQPNQRTKRQWVVRSICGRKSFLNPNVADCAKKEDNVSGPKALFDVGPDINICRGC